MNMILQWAPFFPTLYIALLATLAVVIFVLARWRRLPDLYARGGFFILLALCMLNPLIVHEARQPLPDKVVVVLDESPSQNIGGRMANAEKILAELKLSLPSEPVIIRAGLDPASQRNQNTSLFTELKNNLMSIPTGQVAGTIIITDGQVHDIPADLGPLTKLAPFNVILTGRKDEFDRKITVVEAPKYELLGHDVTIKLRVDDTGRTAGVPLTLTARQDGKPVGQYPLTTGSIGEYTFKISHAGQNIFDFSVAAEPDELTSMNNQAAVIVNGIRDRLRVLLVSGMPHMGERAWRDLLKSDPAIDLIHFSILRSPRSFDSTPTNEMSLIAFPVDELFEKKIREFDLIIFDKYVQYGLLQQQYFANIASFVKEGGAFLMAMGSDEAEQSLFDTALGPLLPVTVKPNAGILSGSYVPQLTEEGKSHPVTADLETGRLPWGPWFSQADVERTQGKTLMSGIDGRPLLILDQQGEGRVAVLTSDNIWLWSKGLHGGGPYTELLRHVGHWLMKEPELEEDYIKAEVKGDTIAVSQRSDKEVIMTRPDGGEEKIVLETRDQSWNTTQVTAGQNGIYRFSNGSKTAFAVVGAGSGDEFSDIHTTAERLAPITQATDGKIIWHDEGAYISRLHLKEGNAYTVTGIDSAPLFPGWISLMLLMGGLLWVWRREGK